MKRTERTQGRRVVIVLFVGLAACSSQTVRFSAERCRSSEADPQFPLQLIVCMAEPSEGASGPAFSVRLKNTSGEPLSLQTRFDASGIVSVRRLDGEIDPASWDEPASLPWTMTTYLLPRGGMIGREFDLGCMRPDFSPAVTPCYSVHDWEPGEYEFKFEFGEFGFCRVRPCDPENVEDWQMPFYTESGFKIDPIRMRLRARSGWEVMP